jgi:hypothetical protein
MYSMHGVIQHNSCSRSDNDAAVPLPGMNNQLPVHVHCAYSSAQIAVHSHFSLPYSVTAPLNWTAAALLQLLAAPWVRLRVLTSLHEMCLAAVYCHDWLCVQRNSHCCTVQASCWHGMQHVHSALHMMLMHGGQACPGLPCEK